MWNEMFACLNDTWFGPNWFSTTCWSWSGHAYWDELMNWPTLRWIVFVLFGVPVAAFIVTVLVNLVMRIASRV